MWALVQQNWPVWYFDATGSVLEKIKRQGEAFLYSLVFHDKDRKLIFPFTEFISTGNDSQSIAG